MRQLVLLLLASLAFAGSSLRAQTTDPGDIFVNAYMAVQEGEKLEGQGKVKEAIAKLRYAAQMLDQISTKSPTWQPSIVEYRKKRTSEALTRLQDKAGRGGSGKADLPGALPPGVDNPLPPTGGDLPELFPPPDSFPSTNPAPTRRDPPPRATDRKAVQPELPTNEDPLRVIERRMSKLTDDLEAARKEADQAQKEKADLAKQLQDAVKAREAADKKREILESRSASAEAALLQIKSEGRNDSEQAKKLQDEMSEVRKQLRDQKIDAEAEAEFRQQLQDRVRAARQKIEKLTLERNTAVEANVDVPNKVGEIQKQLDAAQKEKNDVLARLSKTETELKQVVQQRDEALAQVAQMKEAQKKVDQLVAENTQLMQKLGAAEKTIMEVKADGTKKDQEIAALTKEVNSVKGQLAQAQKESAGYQKQMTDLQTKLTESNAQIAQMKTDNAKVLAEKTKLSDENLMLRGIVLRQQKEEARRSQTKKLVLAELAKLENKSKVLMDQIEYLSGPVQKLSEKEKALFKKPELQISDTEISMTVGRSEEPNAFSESPLPVIDVVPTATPSAPPEKPASTPGKVAAVPTPAATPKTAPPGKTAESGKIPGIPDLGIEPALPSKGPEATPALSLGAGVKPTMDLASNKPVLPSSLTKMPESTERTSEKPTPTPEETAPAKAPGEKEAPLATTDTNDSSDVTKASFTSGSASASSLPTDLLPMAREAKDQFEKGNYRDAERTYEKVLTKAPSNLYTLSNLGVVYFRSGKFKRAEEMFKKAIAIAPEDAFSHCTLGIVYYSQQKYDDAVTELTKALAINPKNATAHNYLGITASQKGWQEAAQKELETATTLDPGYADAFFNLAVVYATQQPPNKELARKFYKRATELGADPDTALEQLIK